jgi:hypothetical protein
MLLRLQVQGIQELSGRVLGLLTVWFRLYDILFFSQLVFANPVFELKSVSRDKDISGGHHAVF